MGSAILPSMTGVIANTGRDTELAAAVSDFFRVSGRTAAASTLRGGSSCADVCAEYSLMSTIALLFLLRAPVPKAQGPPARGLTDLVLVPSLVIPQVI